MHLALPGSALVHATVLGVGLLMFSWPEPDDAPAAQSVSVEVISIASVSANQTSTIESDATETLVSSGAEALPPAVPETIKAAEPETLQPSVAPTAAPFETVAPVQPVQQPTLQPTEVTDLKAAPVPHVLSRPRPSEPTQRPPQQVAEAPLPRATPKPPVQQQARPRPSAPAGNGGQNQADAVAAKPSSGQQGNSGSGGDADVARYPNQVVSKLRRALRYPRSGGGATGEVHVQFTVSAGGQPSGISIVQSSGNAAIDQAGIDTVTRAAPFPPIPAGADRNSWAFTVPLAFTRG
ncbi:MAG: TonB family protein [Devosia sp.]